MNMTIEQSISLELENRLAKAWVLAKQDVDIEPYSNGFPARLDFAIHTNSYIFGGIIIGNVHAPRVPGVEVRKCTSIDDVQECVKWAAALQEKHCRSQTVRMVA